MTEQSPSAWRSLVRRLAYEPFVHFVLLGALLFAIHGLWGSVTGSQYRIEVSQSDQARLRALAQAQWQKEPDAAQMLQFIERHVYEEILVREALAAGLEKDDVIIRRRLVQKMEFLHQGALETPSEPALRDYYTTHLQDFMAPPTLDLQTVYFNASKPGESAQQRATAALRRSQADNAPPSGEPFMLETSHTGITQASIARDFGDAFAQAVFALTPGQWSGPIASVHGWHLVKVLRHTPAAPVPFEAARERVTTAYAEAHGAQTRQAEFARLRARYTVVISPLQTP